MRDSILKGVCLVGWALLLPIWLLVKVILVVISSVCDWLDGFGELYDRMAQIDNECD